MVTTKDLRTFEFIWALIFAVIAFYPLFSGSGDIRLWAFGVSMLFVLIALIKPTLLTGFYHTWIKVGEFIGGIVSKVIMFILFYGMFAPIGIIFRLLGKDLLKKKWDTSVKSYWIEREEQPGSLKNQY